MKIKLSTTFTLQRASKEVCDQFKKPYGIIEVLNSNGEREAFAETEQAARDAAYGAVGSYLTWDAEDVED